MLYAAIDIHKHAFQAAVFDAESGEVVEDRFSADRESLGRWANEWCGRVEALAIEAATGWLAAVTGLALAPAATVELIKAVRPTSPV